MGFPRTVEEITPEWLTQVMRESGAIKQAIVQDFEIGGKGDFRGLVGNVNRVLLEYKQEEDGLPNSVMMKMANTDDELRTRINDLGYTRA